MAIGLIGRKLGMTRIFGDDGGSVPVTVVAVEPNRVTQVKSLERDGYRAIQVTTGTRKASRLTKPMAGQFRAAEVEAGRGLWEFRMAAGEGDELAPGSSLTVDLFEIGQLVDVVGTSIGKGFAGTIKRHNFGSQRMTHGNSKAHRVPGSIGQNQTPGRVFKGKKMAGQLGNRRTTVQNLEIVRVEQERNLLLIKGGVTGAKNSNLMIRPAVKAARLAS